MRVRPFFWIFLATICISVLVFAATISAVRAVPMLVHIDQISTNSTSSTLVRLHLTDPDGLPIDQASVTPAVSMIDMTMSPQQTSTHWLGQGIYLTSIHFSMAGSWNIDIIAHADGFVAIQQSIQLFVQ